jgi:hypothetical protein
MKMTITRKTNGRTVVRIVFGSLMTLTLEYPSGL